MNDRQIIADAKTRIQSGDWSGAVNLLINANDIGIRQSASQIVGIRDADETIKRKVIKLLDRKVFDSLARQ